MTTILIDNFETRLGTIRTWIETDGSNFQRQENSRFTTKGHEITFQAFDLKQVWTPEEMQYETSRGWRWFIRKANNQKEQLTIFCKLINPSSDTEWGTNSGEHLDAIEIENESHHLHIGTEDGEIMQYRADVSDWMPERFKVDLGWSKSFTEYIDFGFKTTVPDLKESEKIYFHFMVATNSIKPSKDYPNERDISTWFAVDQYKKTLDEKLTNTAGNSGLASVGQDE